MLTSSLPCLDRRLQLGQRLVQVGHQAVVGDLEDGRLGVGVDGDDDLAALHAGQVLVGAADAGGDVQLGGHHLAGLADLQVVGDPAGVHGGARGAHRAAQLVGQLLHRLEVALGAAAAGDDHAGLGQLGRCTADRGFQLSQLAFEYFDA